MIINFSELTIPFHRLAPGAILVSPKDGRYLKSIAVDWEYCWVQDTDLFMESGLSDTQMKSYVGDGEGWKVLP